MHCIDSCTQLSRQTTNSCGRRQLTTTPPTPPFPCPFAVCVCAPRAPIGNYNGTCPTRYDAPQAGEVLSAPTKGCDFSLTLSDDPDFVITSQVAGACEQNLKMYVHAVCLKNEATSASSMLSSLAALPSSLSKMFSGSMMAIGGGSRAGEPQLDTRPTLGGGASLKRADSGEVGVLEAGKANAAAATVPVVAKAAAAAAAAVVFVLAL